MYVIPKTQEKNSPRRVEMPLTSVYKPINQLKTTKYISKYIVICAADVFNTCHRTPQKHQHFTTTGL